MDIIQGSPLGSRVIEVIPSDDYTLFLTFSNGEHRIFNAEPLLEFEAFHPLKSKSFFKTVKISHGSIFWSPNIDYCPDTLYAESTPVSDQMHNAI